MYDVIVNIECKFVPVMNKMTDTRTEIAVFVVVVVVVVLRVELQLEGTCTSSVSDSEWL